MGRCCSTYFFVMRDSGNLLQTRCPLQPHCVLSHILPSEKVPDQNNGRFCPVGAKLVVKIWPCVGGNYLPPPRAQRPVEKRKSLHCPKLGKVKRCLAGYSEGFATEPISPRQNCVGDSGRRRGRSAEFRRALFRRSPGT